MVDRLWLKAQPQLAATAASLQRTIEQRGLADTPFAEYVDKFAAAVAAPPEPTPEEIAEEVRSTALQRMAAAAARAAAPPVALNHLSGSPAHLNAASRFEGEPSRRLRPEDEVAIFMTQEWQRRTFSPGKAPPRPAAGFDPQEAMDHIFHLVRQQALERGN